MNEMGMFFAVLLMVYWLYCLIRYCFTCPSESLKTMAPFYFLCWILSLLGIFMGIEIAVYVFIAFLINRGWDVLSLPFRTPQYKTTHLLQLFVYIPFSIFILFAFLRSYTFKLICIFAGKAVYSFIFALSAVLGCFS